MPQNGENFVGRRRARHNTCKANDVVSSQVPSTGLVNGPVVHKYCSAAASRTCESTPAGTLCDSKPPRMVNGYINHGYRGNITTAVPPKTLRKQGGMISAIGDSSSPGRLSRASDPGSITVNGATKQDSVDLPRNFNQVVPDPSLPASGKNQRRRRYYRHKKRYSEVACLGNSASPLMPPQEEDWENEIQEVTLTEWEQKCFGVRPYGPEDVLHFALRDLTLKQRDTMDLPVTASYRPVVHHPSPVKWFCYSIPTEPDQFADADEKAHFASGPETIEHGFLSLLLLGVGLRLREQQGNSGLAPPASPTSSSPPPPSLSPPPSPPLYDDSEKCAWLSSYC